MEKERLNKKASEDTSTTVKDTELENWRKIITNWPLLKHTFCLKMVKFTWQFQKLWFKMLKISVSRMNSHSTRKAMERQVGKTEKDSRPRIRLLTLLCLSVKSVTYLFRILTSFSEKKCCYPLQNWMLPRKGDNCDLTLLLKSSLMRVIEKNDYHLSNKLTLYY